jgi:hypothetical protein
LLMSPPSNVSPYRMPFVCWIGVTRGSAPSVASKSSHTVNLPFGVIWKKVP